METLRYKTKNGIRGVQRWVIPYFKSRVLKNRFRPMLSYLYTEYKCNIDCHYCFQHDEKRPGMTLETAKQSIDWLHSVGCRVLALMGGEPLMRPDFILDVTRYGAKRGFFVYLPTNGYLLTEKFIDEAGKAGIAAFNIAVDVFKPKEGLPKAFTVIKPKLEYLVKKQKKYGYIIFFNINITSQNMDDVKELTEIARKYRIGTDYHVAEQPLHDHEHFEHKDYKYAFKGNDFEKFDKLIDWLVEKQNKGYPMVNSNRHLKEMKGFIRGKHNHEWDCRAGHNGSFIRPDGKLSPCFEMFDSPIDWGTIWNPKFSKKKLTEMKKECRKHCLSTCYQTMASYYDLRNITEWVKKHTLVG